MSTLTSLLPGPFSPNAETLQNLFDEYEGGSTPEAIFIKDVDKYELLVQALEYEEDAVERGDELTGLKDLSSFFSTRKGIKSELVKGWATDLMKHREKLWERARRREESCCY